MIRTFGFVVLLALAGCSAAPQQQYAASACSANPGGFECQVENYFRAP